MSPKTALLIEERPVNSSVGQLAYEILATMSRKNGVAEENDAFNSYYILSGLIFLQHKKWTIHILMCLQFIIDKNLSTQIRIWLFHPCPIQKARTKYIQHQSIYFANIFPQGQQSITSNYILISLQTMLGEQTPESSGEKRVRGKRSAYARISLKARLVFFRKVVEEGADLRQIARRLKINFSTAKTLLRNYRPAPEADPQLVDSLCAEFQARSRVRKRCSYRTLEEYTASSQEGRSEESGGSELGSRWMGGRIEIISHSLCQQ